MASKDPALFDEKLTNFEDCIITVFYDGKPIGEVTPQVDRKWGWRSTETNVSESDIETGDMALTLLKSYYLKKD